MLNTKLLGSVSSPPAEYVEDVFSTYLYNGTGANQTITNGIDLAGKGGLTWIKARTQPSFACDNVLFDTTRGALKYIRSNTTDAEYSSSNSLTSFNNNGFSLGTDSTNGQVNWSGHTYCSWTFREQPKFFDVVTYTATGGTQNVSHSLGSVPGFLIIKRTDASQNWQIAARRNDGYYELMDFTSAASGGFTTAGTLGLTSTTFNANAMVSTSAGQTYVAYLFAHNAGGFGAAGTDNVISCGSFTTDGSGIATVSLGYEPQYVMVKRTDAAGNWHIYDIMREASNTDAKLLYPNLSNSEATVGSASLVPTATGFTCQNAPFGASRTYIYMAIRRPMKPPTVATTVFNPVYGQSGAPGFRSSNFNAGMDTSFVFLTSGYNDGTNAYQNLQTRLTGTGQLQTGNNRAEVSQSYNTWDYMNGQNNTTFYSPPWGSWMFKRASGFHDVVCYTGDTGAATNKNHNLGVVPELIIIKGRDRTSGYPVWRTATGTGNIWGTLLNTAAADADQGAPLMLALPTSTTFRPALTGSVNASGFNYVAYLFATVAGVSKVGSYTGNGGTQAIACGFTGGARFVLIKRTDSTGDWYVYDTTRGMTTTTNPYLLLNTYDAEVATLGSVTTTTGGFTVDATVLAAINTNAASYIFLAIA